MHWERQRVRAPARVQRAAPSRSPTRATQNRCSCPSWLFECALRAISLRQWQVGGGPGIQSACLSSAYVLNTWIPFGHMGEAHSPKGTREKAVQQCVSSPQAKSKAHLRKFTRTGHQVKGREGQRLDGPLFSAPPPSLGSLRP